MKFFFSLAMLFASLQLFSQNTITLTARDADSGESLMGVNFFIKNLEKGAQTDLDGRAELAGLPSGEIQIECTYVGYETIFKTVHLPEDGGNFIIEMASAAEGLDEVIVTSNRANRSVANTPSRIEVLTDEVEEAATMDPSKIAHLLMHTTGVQVQQTSATSGTASVRIQGQYGRYTQILKDGFPIYGGFTGGLGVLQIPPLDLKQVEFVKGSSSTLYGGGAIAGLINLISKEPKEKEEISLHMNLSHIGNTDLNSFFSKKSGKWGVTVFASNNTNRVYDVDDDEFSDVPQVRKFNFNPKVFYYLNEKTTFSLGGTFTNENRIGGEVDAVKGLQTKVGDAFFERNKSQQITSQFKVDHELNHHSTLTFRNSTNRFERNIFLNDYGFAGTQFSTFSEASYAYGKGKQSFVGGLNLYSDDFKEIEIQTPDLRDQSLLTFGAFAQYIWDVDPKFSAEAGFRTDHNTDYGTFFLPKLSLIYKPSLRFTARLGGGMGYKLPSIFTEDAETFAFESINPINSEITDAERSFGGNGELTFRLFTLDDFSLTFTEYLFYNRLNDPLVLTVRDNLPGYEFVTGSGHFETKGFESLLKASAGHFHLYLGHTFVDAISSDGNEDAVLPLTPRHSFHGDLMFIEEGKWRVGLDAEYESTQVLASGREVRSLFKAGFLAERMIENFSIYINLENFTDTRQTRYEPLFNAPTINPRFTEVWAPLDGFIFNAGMKLKM